MVTRGAGYRLRAAEFKSGSPHCDPRLDKGAVVLLVSNTLYEN